MSKLITRIAVYGLLLVCVVASAGAQTVTYIHTDALGSVVAESDANGNVIKRYDYEPYGAVVGGQVTDGPGYTGHVSDSATGLSYMQQRYMDPLLGVFLSVDPVTAYDQPVGQFNRYRYANGNPYKFKDPDGRSATCGERSCVIECTSGFACAVDYVYVGTVYGGRLLRNAVESILPVIQQSQSPKGDAPALPEGLVGIEDKGSRQQGGRVNNGPLAPDNGGVGDGLKDFGTLTGGKFDLASEGSRLPEGAQVGDNGVIYRPGNAGSGPRIDIPANGEKPHETLHYPKPPPPPERSGL
ncbi:RHS repeat-associated protein [Stenotrophomonas sp. AN71]|uniref:RHS repeat domain-containing protein n=1 Tax=Stenotrophomonas sp. AN71 TaxID=3156253 RepID=UPI003D1E4395